MVLTLIAGAFSLYTWVKAHSGGYVRTYSPSENCVALDASNWNGFDFIKFVDSKCHGDIDKTAYWDNNTGWHEIDSKSRYFPIF